jgi:hypothetical protein
MKLTSKDKNLIKNTYTININTIGLGDEIYEFIYKDTLAQIESLGETYFRFGDGLRLGDTSQFHFRFNEKRLCPYIWNDKTTLQYIKENNCVLYKQISDVISKTNILRDSVTVFETTLERYNNTTFLLSFYPEVLPILEKLFPNEIDNIKQDFEKHKMKFKRPDVSNSASKK